MASSYDSLATFKANLIAAAAAWTGSGLKEVSITSPTGKTVTYRSFKDLTDAIKDVNTLMNLESPDIGYSRGY